MDRCTVMNDTLAWDINGNWDNKACLDIATDTLCALPYAEEALAYSMGYGSFAMCRHLAERQGRYDGYHGDAGESDDRAIPFSRRDSGCAACPRNDSTGSDGQRG